MTSDRHFLWTFPFWNSFTTLPIQFSRDFFLQIFFFPLLIFYFFTWLEKISTKHITLEPLNRFTPVGESNSRAFSCDKTRQCFSFWLLFFLPLSHPHDWILNRIFLTFYSFSSGWMLTPGTGIDSHCRLIKNLSRWRFFFLFAMNGFLWRFMSIKSE